MTVKIEPRDILDPNDPKNGFNRLSGFENPRPEIFWGAISYKKVGFAISDRGLPERGSSPRVNYHKETLLTLSLLI